MEISGLMVGAAIAFVIAALFFGKKKGEPLKEIFKSDKEKTDAAREVHRMRLKLRLLRARREREKREAEIRAALDARPVSDDPLADLRDRLDRGTNDSGGG